MLSTLTIDSAKQPIQQRPMDREIDETSWLRLRVKKMQKAFLLLSPLLLAATMAAAQAAPPHSHFAATPGNPSSAMAGQPGSAQSDSLRGCLSGSKGNYTLADHQGKQHRVAGDNHALWDETGHEVDLTGSGSASNTFQESEITDIASRCWNFTLN